MTHPTTQTAFERVYRLCAPFLPVLSDEVRRELLRVVAPSSDRPCVLDVGGRKSPYTIGLPADVTISDLPRLTDVQVKLNLGVDEAIAREAKARRSNVLDIVLDDMTRTGFPDDSFDVVVAVEVLEHVDDDESFIRNVRQVLKPDGVFIMTTPNGDAVPNTNPDHRRHYRRDQLLDLLGRFFPSVAVRYAVRDSQFRRWGLRSWTPRRPGQTALSMFGNFVNHRESSAAPIAELRDGTRHLIAVARVGR